MNAEAWWFDPWEGQNFEMFSKISILVAVPNQYPIQWVLDVKWPTDEVDHSSPCRTEDKNEWSLTSTPPYTFMA